MAKRILVVTGDAGESYECLYARHRLLEAGHRPVVAAPSHRRLHLVIHDFEPGWDTYVERRGYGVESDLTFDDVKVEEYDAALLLGGRAPEYLRHDSRVVSIVRTLHEEGKWLFALCHGCQILIAAGLAAGVDMTGYEHVRSEVETAGGVYREEEAVRHGRIVTGQTWQSHPEFYRLVMAALEE